MTSYQPGFVLGEVVASLSVGEEVLYCQLHLCSEVSVEVGSPHYGNISKQCCAMNRHHAFSLYSFSRRTNYIRLSFFISHRDTF